MWVENGGSDPLLTQKYEVIAVLHLSEIVCPRANERH
jgi:hypothetical protein